MSAAVIGCPSRFRTKQPATFNEIIPKICGRLLELSFITQVAHQTGGAMTNNQPSSKPGNSVRSFFSGRSQAEVQWIALNPDAVRKQVTRSIAAPSSAARAVHAAASATPRLAHLFPGRWTDTHVNYRIDELFNVGITWGYVPPLPNVDIAMIAGDVRVRMEPTKSGHAHDCLSEIQPVVAEAYGKGYNVSDPDAQEAIGELACAIARAARDPVNDGHSLSDWQGQ